jgi:hypothetical protein
MVIAFDTVAPPAALVSKNAAEVAGVTPDPTVIADPLARLPPSRRSSPASIAVAPV